MDIVIEDIYRKLRNSLIHTSSFVLDAYFLLEDLPIEPLRNLKIDPIMFIDILKQNIEVINEEKIIRYLISNYINIYSLYDQIDKILNYLKERGLKYRAILYLFEDTEVSSWKRLILDIIISKENKLNFNEIIDLWESIYSEIKFYDELKEHLVISVIPGE